MLRGVILVLVNMKGGNLTFLLILIILSAAAEEVGLSLGLAHWGGGVREVQTALPENRHPRGKKNPQLCSYL